MEKQILKLNIDQEAGNFNLHRVFCFLCQTFVFKKDLTYF